MIRPSNNTITLLFGATTPPYSPQNPHIGVDFAPDNDAFIYAPENGRITLTPNDPQMGNAVHLWVDNRHHAFCHTSTYLVSDAQQVQKGDKLAVMGYTGYVVPSGPSGTHLHWALAVDNTLIDPLSQVTEKFMQGEGNPNAGDVDNAYLAINNRKATDQEKQLYTMKAWNDPQGLYYGKVLADFKNIQSMLVNLQQTLDPKLIAALQSIKSYFEGQ